MPKFDLDFLSKLYGLKLPDDKKESILTKYKYVRKNDLILKPTPSLIYGADCHDYLLKKPMKKK